MKGKLTFTQSEANQIIALIRKKLVASPTEQKNIRTKIRAIGFYATDFKINGGYREHDFLNVIKIVGDYAKPKPTSEINKTTPVKIKAETSSRKRSNSDEAYIIDLCDEVLKLKASRQHRFDFLRGDAGTTLPIDAFYPTLSLAIEYREKQHSEEVKFFDRRITASGVSRGEQRKIYDQRRRDILPNHHITLIEIGYDDFEHSRSKQLLRNKVFDIEIIRQKLKGYQNRHYS